MDPGQTDPCRLVEILAAAQPGQPVHKVLSPHCGESEGVGGGWGVYITAAWCLCSVEYSSALIGHCLLEAGFDAGVKLGKGFKLDEGDHGNTHVPVSSQCCCCCFVLPDMDRLVGVLEACRAVFRDIQTKQSKASMNGSKK